MVAALLNSCPARSRPWRACFASGVDGARLISKDNVTCSQVPGNELISERIFQMANETGVGEGRTYSSGERIEPKM
jgi:hypothetical protein